MAEERNRELHAAKPCEDPLDINSLVYPALENVAGGGTSSEEAAAVAPLIYQPQQNSPFAAEAPDAPVRSLGLTRCQSQIMAVFTRAAGEPLSRKSVALRANCCDRTVKRAMPKLVKLGLVKVKHRFMADGGQLSNVYFVTAKGGRILAPNSNNSNCRSVAAMEASLPGP